MWKTRFIANGRCYHLISRLAHQAFFLDDDEKTRAVELLRRAEDYEWCSFVAAVRGGATRRRGYALMYGNGDWEAIQACHEQSMCEAMGEVLAEREKEERVVKGCSASSVRNRAPRLKAAPGLETPKRFSVELERGNPAVAERILELLADGPMRPSALRKAVGIRHCTHFNRYYLAPLLAKGIVERTDPAHPQSPQQKYRLV